MNVNQDNGTKKAQNFLHDFLCENCGTLVSGENHEPFFDAVLEQSVIGFHQKYAPRCRGFHPTLLL